MIIVVSVRTVDAGEEGESTSFLMHLNAWCANAINSPRVELCVPQLAA
jgi:hypothetical protein